MEVEAAQSQSRWSTEADATVLKGSLTANAARPTRPCNLPSSHNLHAKRWPIQAGRSLVAPPDAQALAASQVRADCSRLADAVSSGDHDMPGGTAALTQNTARNLLPRPLVPGHSANSHEIGAGLLSQAAWSGSDHAPTATGKSHMDVFFANQAAHRLLTGACQALYAA